MKKKTKKKMKATRIPAKMKNRVQIFPIQEKKENFACLLLLFLFMVTTSDYKGLDCSDDCKEWYECLQHAPKKRANHPMGALLL